MGGTAIGTGVRVRTTTARLQATSTPSNPADRRQHGGFHQELVQDVAPARAHGFADPDLVRALA